MNSIFKLVVLVAMFCLSACARTGPSGLMLRDSPILAEVKITKDNSCNIKAQTVKATCPFIGDTDPVDVVCQNPSVGTASIRKIEWTSSESFTLNFPNGHPFVNTNGSCKISTASKIFTCIIKNNPTEPSYKYDIFFSSRCHLDPRIFLIR